MLYVLIELQKAKKTKKKQTKNNNRTTKNETKKKTKTKNSKQKLETAFQRRECKIKFLRGNYHEIY